MNIKNMKCPECGYRFQDDATKGKGTCPLCSREYDTKKAIEYYINTYGAEDTNESSGKPKSKMIRDWIIFGVSFGAFILIMQFLITYIANC